MRPVCLKDRPPVEAQERVGKMVKDGKRRKQQRDLGSSGENGKEIEKHKERETVLVHIVIYT